jgi:hypothetical protein
MGEHKADDMRRGWRFCAAGMASPSQLDRKTKLPLAERPAGQAIVCEVEVELNERGEQARLIAFEIKST